MMSSGMSRRGLPQASDLRLFKLFHGLSDDDLAPLCAVSRFIDVADGKILLEEGDFLESIFLITEGAFAFFREGESGEQLLSHLGVGSFYGELGLFGLDQSVSLRSVGDGQLVEIPHKALRSFCETHPSIHRRLEISATNMAVALELGRRQEVRIRIHQQVDIELDDGTVVDVLLENMSPGGLCLTFVPQTWLVGEKVRFVLKAPPGILHLSGKVVWRYKKRVGIALDRNLPDHGMVIQKTVRAFLEAEV